jgi:hypothetical protein
VTGPGPIPPLEGWAEDDGKVHEFLGDTSVAIDLGDGMGLSGETPKPRWTHLCGVKRPDGHRTSWVRVWSVLSHDVTVGPKGVTIRPSLLCSRCLTHGWITDSKWAPV